MHIVIYIILSEVYRYFMLVNQSQESLSTRKPSHGLLSLLWNFTKPRALLSQQLDIEVCRYAQIRLEEGITSLINAMCHQGVKYEEHYVCHYIIFYEIRGRYHCLFKQGFGPLHKVMEYDEPTLLGAFLARTQETHGKVVARQQYSHTSSSTKNNHNFL